MKTKNIFWAALSMTAALVMTACSEDMMTETPQAPSTSKIIPYTVTVNGGATTRATVADDNKTLKFATGDKLYITGTNIKGVLGIQTGDGTTTGPGTASATFSGDLTYSGEGTPASDLSLTATLVSAQQADGSEVTINATTGAVTVNYPTTSYCGDVATAVQKYSNLTGTSTYSTKSFSLTQQTAFLNFVITFEDGTATSTTLSAKVNNNSADICTANVTTTTESEKVVAKFVLPVAKGTTLSSAKVTMGSKAAISFGASETLEGKVYNVTKTQAAAAKVTTAPTATTGTIAAGSTTALVTAGAADGGTMMYNVTTTNSKPSTTDGFSATVPTAEGRAAGTYFVWYYAKADATHSDSEIAATAIEVTLKIPGLLTGVFTVKASPLTKVQFSQGNLQYQASTSTWRFADHQYDYVGNAVGNTTSTGRDSQADWIDLFGWGTAGHSFASGYGEYYQPWATDNSDYTKYGPTDGTSSLTGTYAQGDWGTNMGAGWRTLSKDEWEWLLGPKTSPNPGTNCRTSSTIGGTTNARWVKATVHSKKGLIIFPDEISWDVTTMGTAPTTINPTTSDNFTYAPSDAQWSALADKGCVFLPAAGYRDGTTVNSVGSRGFYWSSTVYNAINAYSVCFNKDGLGPADYYYRYYGLSVRLVRPAE